MSDKLVESLDDFQAYGRRWEKQKDLDSRYIPPPPPEKMRVPGAAFTGSSNRDKAMAAVEKEVERENTSPKPTKVNDKKAAKKAARGKGCPSSRLSDGEAKVVTAKVVENRGSPGETEEMTYAAAVHDGQGMQGAPVNQSGSYGPGRGYGNEAWRGTAGAGQAPDPWRTAPPRGGYGRPSGANQPSGGRADERPFTGVYNLCQAVGHRASVSPDVICFWCRLKGHTMRNCPTRSQPPATVHESCQVCDAPNVTFRTCSRCAPLRKKLGNGPSGGQTR